MVRQRHGIESIHPLVEAIPYAIGLAVAVSGYAMVVVSWYLFLCYVVPSIRFLMMRQD